MVNLDKTRCILYYTYMLKIDYTNENNIFHIFLNFKNQNNNIFHIFLNFRNQNNNIYNIQ
jgi:hypothetical protein